jgi:acetyltransferase-like isoleucine patch superfamily enzyme
MSDNPKYVAVGQGVVQINDTSKIGANVQFIFNKPGKVRIGDYCIIGSGAKFIISGGDVIIGDWTSIHDNCLIMSGAYVNIGEHCWFGQHSVLDGSGGLKIGKGVRVGMYSQIWSHVAAGEQIEGCTLYGERPVEIEDDVWLVGSCIVASGVIIGKRTVALIGSNITKSWPKNSVLAGSPAALKQNIEFYQKITLDEKWGMIEKWIYSIVDDFSLSIENHHDGVFSITSSKYDGKIYFVKTENSYKEISCNKNSTICCIESKKYTKKITMLEQVVLKFLSGNKARFISQ